MEYRTYGKTGIEVSALGMGGMRFQNAEDIDGMAQVVLRASELGVTYFDTAPGYNADKSEIIFGTAIKEIKKTGRPFRIATKTMAGDGATVRKHCEQSLQRLNVDCIDFYHVWCLLRPGQLEQRKKNGVLDEFRKLKEEGLIRHICVSTHMGHDQIEQMLDEGEGLFEGMLLGLNAANFTMRLPGAEAAAARGMGVVTMNPLGGGMIVEHPERFAYMKQDPEETMLEACVRFNMSLAPVTVTLVGFGNVEQAESAIAAAEKMEKLTPEQIERIKRDFFEASEEYCTQCNYCRDCPVDIPVVRFMDAYNEKLLNPERKHGPLGKLKWHWGIPEVEAALEACTECGQCEDVCTQHLPILRRLEEIRAMDREAKAEAEAKK